ADAVNATVAQPDIGLVDARMVKNQRICDDGVHGAIGAAGLALPHAVADHLAAAEFDLFAIDGQVALDLDDDIGVAQTQTVAGSRAVHLRIIAAGNGKRHDILSNPAGP